MISHEICLEKMDHFNCSVMFSIMIMFSLSFFFWNFEFFLHFWSIDIQTIYLFQNIIYSLRRFQTAYCRNCMNNVLLLLKNSSNVNNLNNVNNANDVNVRQLSGVKKTHPVPMLVLKLNKNYK